jgi:NADPH-dependent glutamate synthase beta subunit-like oxidoreductase
LIIEALGQKAPNNLKTILAGVEIVADSLTTSRKGVFAGGDIINGGKMAVTAVSDGMKAAQQINQFLKG